MKKWILSASVYLFVVLGAYYAITSVASPADNPNHSNTEQHDN
ncbi:hypothetical protein [Robertmurraya massiliosenegalensis]|nr:hypothetical protein [Robertmurraya massiliosenegalensis]